MEKLRRRLLESVTRQSDLIEVFRAIDRDCSGRITYEEFHAAIKSLKLGIDSNDEIKSLFQEFDKTHNGQIDLKEFLQQLRPPMSERRQKAVFNLFDSMDVNKDGRITIMDLKTKFAHQLKPTKQRSNQNINDNLRNFLNKFNTSGQQDGIIDKEEFLGFCSMLSATVKEDVYFEHVLRSLFDFRL